MESCDRETNIDPPPMLIRGEKGVPATVSSLLSSQGCHQGAFSPHPVRAIGFHQRGHGCQHLLIADSETYAYLVEHEEVRRGCIVLVAVSEGGGSLSDDAPFERLAHRPTHVQGPWGITHRVSNMGHSWWSGLCSGRVWLKTEEGLMKSVGGALVRR